MGTYLKLTYPTLHAQAMLIDQQVLIAFAGVIGTTLAVLFRALLAAKDAHIGELRETIRYQRELAEIVTGTARRAVGTLEKVT